MPGARSGSTALIPERGDIVDRDGQPLARTIDAWTIALHPAKVIGDKLDLARALARLMPEKDEATYLRDAALGQAVLLPAPPRRRPTLVEAVNALGEPGLAIDREPDRLYPQTSLAAHVIGYTDVDGHGSRRDRARVRRAACRDPATRGEPLTLSISSRIQQALEHELLDAMTTFSAIGAAGIVMDIHTGEMLAMTSLPQLNPNVAGQGSPEARFNRATLGVYELGSTFKPFTVAMAMDSGRHQIASARSTIARDELHVAGRTINDTHPFGRACSVAEIMKESSNIGTAQIAAQLGATRQQAFLDKMGFLDPVGVELKERGRTLTPGNNWRPGRDDDGRLRPRHRGHPAAPRDRLCDPVQRRHLPPGDPAQGRPQPSRRARAAACSARTPATRCARCFGWSSPRAPARRPTRPAIASAARPASAEKYHNRVAAGDHASRAFSRWTNPAM